MTPNGLAALAQGAIISPFTRTRRLLDGSRRAMPSRST